MRVDHKWSSLVKKVVRTFLTNQRWTYKSKWMPFYCHCCTDLNSAYLRVIHYSNALKVFKGDFNRSTRYRYGVDELGCLRICITGTKIGVQKFCWKWTVRNKYNISSNKSVTCKKLLISKQHSCHWPSKFTFKKRRIFYCGNLTKVHFAPCHDAQLQENTNWNLTDLQTSTEVHNQKRSYIIVGAPAQKKIKVIFSFLQWTDVTKQWV